jgi:hypothetical protein
MHKLLLTLTLILLGSFALGALPAAAQSSSCSVYSSQYAIPSGYGAAYNLFSSSRETLLRADCSDSTYTASIKGANTTPSNFAVFDTGYRWTGSKWEAYTLSPDGGSKSGDYILGNAKASNLSLAGNTTYWVAFACNLVSGQWKCGCSDSSCRAPKWNLQVAQKGGVATSDGTVSTECIDKSGGKLNDWFYNPFNHKSAQHRPIGTGAVYAGDNESSTKAWLAYSAFMGSRGVPSNNGFGASGAAIVEAKSSDSKRTIKFNACKGGGKPSNFPHQQRMPSNDWHTTWKNTCQDNHAMFYDAADGMITQYYQFGYNGDNSFAANYISTSIKGLGHGSSYGQREGMTAIGMNNLVAAFRQWEMNTPGQKIYHPFQIAVVRREANKSKNSFPMNLPHILGKRVQWPATNGDGAATNNDENTGPMAYGELLAIPPVSKGGPDLTKLGLSEKGLRVAEALRDYGLYINDGGPNVSRGDRPYDDYQTVKKEMGKLWKHLRVVKNSVTGANATVGSKGSIGTPTYPAGGGTPIAPNCAIDAP